MSKRLFGAIVLISILILAMLTGCQSQANSGATASGSQTSSDGNTIFGQVTAVDGNNITVALIDNSGMGNGRQGQGNQGPSSSNKPQRSPRPSGNWQQSQGSGGTAPSGGRNFGLNLTGESKTFIVTSSTTITMGGMRQYSQNSGSSSASPLASHSVSPASISDIQKGSILSVKLSGDNAVSIIIMQFGNRNGNGANAQASGSQSPGASQDAQPSPSAAPSPSASAVLSSGATPTPSIGAISSY